MSWSRLWITKNQGCLSRLNRGKSFLNQTLAPLSIGMNFSWKHLLELLQLDHYTKKSFQRSRTRAPTFAPFGARKKCLEERSRKWIVVLSNLSKIFRVTQFKIDQNKNQNRSIDEVQNLGKELSGHSNFSYVRYAEKLFFPKFRDLHVWRLQASAPAETNRNILKRERISQGTQKH